VNLSTQENFVILNDRVFFFEDLIIRKENFGFLYIYCVLNYLIVSLNVLIFCNLEEVSFDFSDKKNTRLRVATKYPNLTNNFLVSKGIIQYKLVPSLGATETYPFIGSSEIITDITSTGKTLKDNNLRVLKDGCILNSQACLLISKKKAAILRPFLNSLI